MKKTGVLQVVSLLCLMTLAAVSSFTQTTSDLPVGAVPDRAVRAEHSIQSFRQVGDLRAWTFFGRQTTFGQLSSSLKEIKKIGGQEALVFEETLDIDFSKIGTDRHTQTRGEHWVSPEGGYLGSRYELGPDTALEKLELKRRDDEITGFYTRAGNKIDLSVACPRDLLAWETHFVDQLEMFLAMRDLRVGDIIEDSIFSPLSAYVTPLAGEVKWFMWQEIYKGRIDSVFVIRLSEPQNCQLYFTVDKRLVRVDFVDQGFRVYQDMVRAGETGVHESKPQAGSLSLRAILFRLPHYLAYLVIVVLAVLFISQTGYKWLNCYLAFLAGAVSFVIIPITQIPLQEYAVSHWLLPRVTGGGSVYVWGLIPSLIAGIVQEAVKLAAVFGFIFWRAPREYRLPVIAAYLYGGFGFVESCYVLEAGLIPLFNWSLLERAFLILFHTAGGAVIGHSILKGSRRLIPVLLLVMAVNTCFRYLPIFVQKGAVDLGLMHFIMAFITLAFVVVAILMMRRVKQEVSSSPVHRG